jgi:3-deoxy-7-phosphoheptulonate synthase
MLVVIEDSATPADVQQIFDSIEAMGLRAHALSGRNALGVTGMADPERVAAISALPAVRQVIPVTHSWKLVSRELRPEDTRVEVGGVVIGGEAVAVIAGPCAVESLDRMRRIAEGVRNAGAHILRGGAFKPRTSPYSFQGLGEAGLEILARVREEFELPVVTEALDHVSLGIVAQYADAVQIGARNMQNFTLLKAAGQGGKPVLLKRGMSATLEELLLSAEYIMAEGNHDVILCERGVRTFSDHTRNTLDLSIVPAVKRASHLPIIVDPSHGTGRRENVLPMARAAIAAGADGVMVEVHDQPELALSDGQQAILLSELATLVSETAAVAAVLGRPVAPAAVGS